MIDFDLESVSTHDANVAHIEYFNSEYYLDDKDFIKKAISIDPNSIKYASKRLRQDKTIAKLILKKDKKLANKYIFKKTLKEIL